MKKKLLGVVAAILLVSLFSCATKGAKTEHNSRNSLDWAGVYAGVTPSAGGEGINVMITLGDDETYTVETQYIGKSDEIFTRTGTFTWKPDGNTIILDGERDGASPSYYKLGEKTLTQLDLEGNVITGAFANDYVLKKQP